MARLNTARLNPDERRTLQHELVRAIRVLKKEEIWDFLNDLLTPSEILMLGRRIRIARGLLDGKRYEEIAKDENASYSTIQLVDRSLQRGLEGYRRVLPRTARAARGRPTKLPNETIEMVRRLPGAGYFRFWLNLLDTDEKK